MDLLTILVLGSGCPWMPFRINLQGVIPFQTYRFQMPYRRRMVWCFSGDYATDRLFTGKSF